MGGADRQLQKYRGMRDFRRTPEPRGGTEPGPDAGGLRFVIQKHRASHLHFDLRLELDGVLKSWAVPKGPSADPSVKRLAMEVEDHPLEYGGFEGTIPQHEYGGGTVMLWDRGTYEPDEPGADPQKAMRRELRRGKVSITFHGERIRGSYALVRMRGEDASKPQWLLIKHDDEEAEQGLDLAAEHDTSVATGRSMDEIAAGKGGERVWRSDRGEPDEDGEEDRAASPPDLASFKPMLAKNADSLPRGDGWTYELKYDGIRVLALVTSGSVGLITRNGNDKARQFPEIVDALRELASDLGRSFILDGEIVGIDDEGRPRRFGSLQSRMHLGSRHDIERLRVEAPAAFVAFDLLLDGDEALVPRPWSQRREALEALLGGELPDAVRLAETSADPDALLRRAREDDWEGLMAKRVDSTYAMGQRSSRWKKVKLEARQEFVVGGWTEPRGGRTALGAILLGYYDDEGELVYAGHTGTGFKEADLRDMHRRLKRRERKTPPFREKPRTNEKPHWTTPRVVVEIRYNEWTSEGKLRHPVFVGIRDDKDPRDVVLEGPPAVSGGDGGGGPAKAARSGKRRAKASSPPKARQKPAAGGRPGRPAELGGPIVDALRRIDESGGDGVLELESGPLPVTSLGKTFFPESGLTKGDLLRHYAELESLILPAMDGRPLVLKRYPDGIGKESFFQQSAPDSVPDGVRVETLTGEDGKRQRRFVGGNLATLLYTVQLGAISYDPWHSRVDALDFADYTVIDLDPGPGTDFGTVVQVARWVHEELEWAGLHGALKTSGASGLHVYLPLPERTPLEAATLVAQIVASRVAKKHPDRATVERMTRKRRKGTVYVDYLQNILGKTVAGVYAARARPGATVSTPLLWDELTDDLDPTDFTILSVPGRVRRLGDLWAEAMSRPNSLERLLSRGAG